MALQKTAQAIAFAPHSISIVVLTGMIITFSNPARGCEQPSWRIWYCYPMPNLENHCFFRFKLIPRLAIE